MITSGGEGEKCTWAQQQGVPTGISNLLFLNLGAYVTFCYSLNSTYVLYTLPYVRYVLQ